MASFKTLLVIWVTAIWLVKRYGPDEMQSLFSPRWMTVTLYLLPICGWVAWWCILYPKFFSPLRSIPQPSGGSFFMGHRLQISKEPLGDPLRAWVEEVPNDGIIRYVDLVERLAIVGPNALAEVLVQKNDDFLKPPQLVNSIGRILGVGLFLAEGDEHKRQRKNLMPAFAFRHIKDLYPTFWDKSKELVEALIAHTETPCSMTENVDGTVDVGDWASRAALDIIGVAGLGRDFNAIQEPGSELNVTYRKIFSPSRTARVLGILNNFLPQWVIRNLPIQRNDDIEAASLVIKRTCRSLIESKKAKMHQGEQTNADILSVAMTSGEFSDEDLVNQLMTFLVAGHETTGASLAWAMHLLCQHPEIQNRLRKEIRANLPNPRDPQSIVTSSDIDRLPYCKAICNEVLRLFPPVARTVRVAARDTTIVGHFIPKGTVIMLVPWAVNTDKALWGDDAAQFNPERWMGPGMANTGGADSNYSFLTFLHGPRSCIGQAFARAEFACLVAAWVGTFETEMADKDWKVEVKTGLTARPSGLNVRLKVVEGW